MQNTLKNNSCLNYTESLPILGGFFYAVFFNSHEFTNFYLKILKNEKTNLNTACGFNLKKVYFDCIGF